MEENRALSDVCRTLKVINDKKTKETKKRRKRKGAGGLNNRLEN